MIENEESEIVSGISIEVENYKVFKSDSYNVLLQSKKRKQDGTGEYWITEGYYSTIEGAFISLFRKVTKDANKKSIKDTIIEIRRAEQSIVEAIKASKI